MVVVGGGRDVARSHAEILAVMPAYAAGALSGRAEDVVRRHLAAGCRQCLDALYERPFGIAGASSAESKPAQRTLSVVTAVLVVIALMGTVFASTMWLTGIGRSPAAPDPGRRWLASLEAHATDAEARLESLAQRSTSLEAHLGPLSHESETAPRSAPASVPRRGESARTERALIQLGSALVLPGTRVEPLHPVAGASGARGWLIRDTLRGRLFVYAIGLPRLVTPWNARVAFGETERRLPLRRMIDGSLWGIFDHIGDSACAVRVAIVPPTGDRTVLAGDLACRAAPRA